MHVGESEVAALVFVGQPGVVDAQAVQDRRLQVVDVHRVACDVVAVVVRLADRQPRPYAAARQPDRETARVVIAPVLFGRQPPLAVDRPLI